MPRDSRTLAWGLICACLGLTAAAARAAERTPIPEFTGERLYVRDVPDTFQALPRVIGELEGKSPQTYFVVVIRTAGAQGAAAYVDELFQAWSLQARDKQLPLDPQRSVITLLAMDDRRAAVHAGTLLREQLGLDKETVTRLIPEVFSPLARNQKYAEGTAALLVALNNQVAARDSRTPRLELGADLLPVPIQNEKEKEVAAAPPTQPLRGVPNEAPGSTAAATPQVTARGGTGDLVWGLLASVLAIGLIAGFLVWLARRRARGSVERKIKEYKKKAVDVMDHLDALKSRLKILPAEDPDYTEPMSGATLALYEQAQAELTGLWDQWLEVMEILDKAQALSMKDTALGTEKLKEAGRLVSDAKVFERIEDQARAVAATMDRLNQAHETARAAAAQLEERRKEIDEGVQKVERESLPAVPYRPEIEGIAAQAEQARVLLTPDPIAAHETLELALGRAVKLRDRLGNILERFAEGRKITAELTELASKVAEQRRQGVRLDEEGGNPDHPAALTFQDLESLRRAVHEGDPAAALQHLSEARTHLEQTRQTLESVLAARDACWRILPERVRETQRLREAMPQYQAFEDELRRDFAASSWQPVAGNLAQARALLDTFDRKTDEAQASASPTTQKYLLASRLLEQVAQEQQVVFGLLAGVADQLNGLRALREQCQAAVRGLDDRQHAIERYVSQNADAIGTLARRTLEAAKSSRRQLEGLRRESSPDWPGIHHLLARILDEVSTAETQARGDVEIYQQLGREYERVRQEAARVGSFLAGHQEDRLAANQHYRNAEEALARVRSQRGGPGGEWARLLETVRGAAADLERSEQLAREDIRLARQAESEIEEAARTLRKAHAYFSMGVTVGTAGADQAVSEAQRRYQAQDYEQAVRLAASAIEQVRQAQAVAAQQVFMRQMQVDAARRQSAVPQAGMVLGGAAAGAAVATAASRALGSEVQGSASSQAPAEGSSSAAGSWSSETAEGGW